MALAALISLTWLAWTPQDGPAQDEVSQLPEIVVEGRVLEELARDFIGEVATAAPEGVSVARWHRSVCVGAVNLRPQTAQFLIDRVSSIALDVGVEPGEPGCSPEVIVVATNDGTEVATGLVEKRRRTLHPGHTGFTRSLRALEEFATTDRPVRWWHVSTSVDTDTNRSVTRIDGIGVARSGGGQDWDSIPQMAVVPTLLAATTRQDLLRAIVIVDFSKVGEVDFDQLADYVAFVSLAQVDPEADTASFPTILNVFDDPAATPRLTDWDRAYLQGLYQSDDTAPNNAAREGAIRREMLRARQDGPAAEAE